MIVTHMHNPQSEHLSPPTVLPLLLCRDTVRVQALLSLHEVLCMQGKCVTFNIWMEGKKYKSSLEAEI